MSSQGASIRLSKTLSWVLRHGAAKVGLEVCSDGYVELSKLLEVKQVRKFGCGLEQIQQLVAKNEKKRFSLKLEEGKWWIRANQGHSRQVASALDADHIMTRITLGDVYKFPCVIHGTYREFWSAIQREGLKRMTRQHIHFAPFAFGSKETTSGMRGNCDLVIEIDLAAAVRDGVVFHLSENDVVLTEGLEGCLPPQYFKRVQSVKRKKGLVQLEDVQWKRPSVAKEEVKAEGEGKATQVFERLLVLDFEATCEKGKWPIQEIIEFPVFVVDTRTREVTAKFHFYVRPVHRPQLTAFCTELTGIEQRTVDGAQDFPAVYTAFHKFLVAQGLVSEHGEERCKWAFVTCGDWDLKTMLPKQLKLSKLRRWDYYSHWVNIKKVASKVRARGTTVMLVAEWMQALQKKVFGMPMMLDALGLKFEGRHHSGIDDVANITRCCQELLRRGVCFGFTS